MVDESDPTPPEELLARAPLFSRLSRKSLKRLAELCMARSYPAGEMIITEGSTGLGLFVITAGRIEVYKGDGDARVSLAVMEPGAILGEMALIDDQPRSASAVALEPISCLLITRGSFQQLVELDPEIAWCIVPVLAKRIRALQLRIISGTDGEHDDGSISPDPTEIVVPLARSEDDDSDLLDGLLRGQYAVAMAGIAGMQGALRAMESFMRAFADRSDEDERGNDLRSVSADLAAATESGLEEAERVPERMLSRYRQYRKKKR